MSETDRVFTGSIPALYDRYLGPLIFAEYAADLAQRVAVLTPGRVLETAAGTGIVTRSLVRVLPPGSKIVATDVWDRIEENDFARVVAEAVAALFPDDPPRFRARTPHGYHDVVTIERELRSAGFSEIAVETVSRRSRAPSPRDPAIGFCQGTPLRNEIETRAAGRLAEGTEGAAAALEGCFGPGPIDGKIQAHIITASR